MNRRRESGTLSVSVSPSDHTQGPEAASVTLVEYGDFECPNCAQAYPAVKILRKHFGEYVRFVFRHFPLREVHPHAELAAEAAEAAGAQHKFWRMHGLLFENQLDLKAKRLRQFADQAELDLERYLRDKSSRALAACTGAYRGWDPQRRAIDSDVLCQRSFARRVFWARTPAASDRRRNRTPFAGPLIVRSLRRRVHDDHDNIRRRQRPVLAAVVAKARSRKVRSANDVCLHRRESAMYSAASLTDSSGVLPRSRETM